MLTLICSLVIAANVVTLPVHGRQTQTIVEVARNDPDNFSTLNEVIEAAGLENVLSGGGPFTAFAPNNAAFDKIPADKLKTMLAQPEDLKKIISRHVLLINVPSAEVPIGSTEVPTMGGEKITVVRSGNDISIKTAVGEAKVVNVDVFGSNGVIHVIDAVV